MGKKTINILLYSNLWIAFGALCLCFQTQILLFGTFEFSPVPAVISCGTLVIYGLHRIVGMLRTNSLTNLSPRFAIIKNIRFWIFSSFGLGILGLALSLFFLQKELILWLVAPGLIALGYVVPISKNGKRLRDYAFLKIFALTFTWAWLTVLLPALEKHLWPSVPVLFMSIERFLFLFAIAIAFDLRDVSIDQENQLKTIPLQLGIKKSKRWAILCLSLMLFLAFLNLRSDAYSLFSFGALFISATATSLLILGIKSRQSDYYYSGWVDGMLPFQFFLVALGFI